MRRLVLLAVLAVGSGCQCGGGGSTDAGSDAGGGSGSDAGRDAGPAYDEFDAWRELRAELSKSPDAVPARAAALVLAKDAPGLFALVRDDIALLPTTEEGFDSAAVAVRWGPRATLRGQAGTPRERAELLKALYAQAGFTAEVVSGVPVEGSTAAALLAKGPQRTLRFAPSAPQMAKWRATLRAVPTLAAAAPVELDADGGVRAAVLAQVRPLLPPPPAAVPFSAVPTEVPLVRVVVGGVTQYANPNLDGAAFGPSLTRDPPEVAPPAQGERSLHVVLSASRSARPGEVFPLVERTWKASEVAGRTVTAAFTTPMSRAQAAKAKVGDANAFIPMLLVRGDGLDTEASQALSEVGTSVLADGTRVEVAPGGGGLVIDGEPVALGPTPAARLSAVQSLTVEANAAAFPDVELRVSARGAGGAQVPNLASDAFVVREGGAPVFASLRRTSAGPARVVLLFDRSDSIPAEFVTGAPTVGRAVAQALFTQFPGAQVQVAAVDINGPTVSGPMVSTLAEVDAQLAALRGTGSEVWTAVDAFSASNATAIVVITDAVVDDALTPALGARLVEGPPVLLAAVGTADAATAARIAEVTRGQVLANATAAGLPAAVTAFVGARLGFDYRIVYRAPATGPTPRQVAVALKAPGTAMATAGYTPPAAPVQGSALSALYLTVEADGRSVTRTIAGSLRGDAADREAVAGALFGQVVLGVEAGPPSLSTLVGELLGDRLQLEPVIDALRSGDGAALAQAAKLDVFRTPNALRFLSSALPGEASPGDVTYVDGLTVTLHATLPVLGVKTVKRLDLLPLAPRQTVRFDGQSGKALTVERTSLLAAYEAERFTKSTLASLKGRSLQRYDANSIEALGAQWLGVGYPAYADYDLFASPASVEVAFWAVHKRTGELVGVLPQGGAGEDESTQALVDRLKFILDAAGRAGTAGGYNGIKVWADLEKTKVELLGGVIMLFEGEGPDPRGALANNLCGFAFDAITGPIPLPQIPDVVNMVPDDLNFIYSGIHVITGQDVPNVPGIGDLLPDLPSPMGVVCGALGAGDP